MSPKHWFAFILLGAVWSASFLWIKIAVQEIGPMTLVAYRVALGSLTGIAAIWLARVAWPRDSKSWVALFILGLTSIALPFLLISWGEIYIDSAVAAILNAATPLFTVVIAHYYLSDDRMTVQKVFGLLVGFTGVVVLMSKDLASSSQNLVLGQFAVLLAAILYAGSSVYARKTTRHMPGLVRGTGPLITASLVMWITAPLLESPLRIPALPMTWVALLWLGILGSGLALILWYYLLHEIGPTRTTLVTYIFPLGGVILGVIFLNEQLTWQLLTGTLLIITSVAVVNWKRK